MAWTPNWLAQEVIGGWVGGALTGIFGLILGWIGGWWRKRRFAEVAAKTAAKQAEEQERVALARRFYSGLRPVMEKLARVRYEHSIPPDAIRQVVESIAANLAVPMFGSAEALAIPALLERPEGTIGDCGVCGGEAKYHGNACDRCGLDCFAWDFKVKPATGPGVGAE